MVAWCFVNTSWRGNPGEEALRSEAACARHGSSALAHVHDFKFGLSPWADTVPVRSSAGTVNDGAMSVWKAFPRGVTGLHHQRVMLPLSQARGSCEVGMSFGPAIRQTAWPLRSRP